MNRPPDTLRAYASFRLAEDARRRLVLRFLWALLPLAFLVGLLIASRFTP